jgi:hypothetical protein
MQTAASSRARNAYGTTDTTLPIHAADPQLGRDDHVLPPQPTQRIPGGEQPLENGHRRRHRDGHQGDGMIAAAR